MGPDRWIQLRFQRALRGDCLENKSYVTTFLVIPHRCSGRGALLGRAQEAVAGWAIFTLIFNHDGESR